MRPSCAGLLGPDVLVPASLGDRPKSFPRPLQPDRPRRRGLLPLETPSLPEDHEACSRPNESILARTSSPRPRNAYGSCTTSDLSSAWKGATPVDVLLHPTFAYQKRYQFQIDLIDLGNLIEENDGNRYLLTAIDIFT